MSLDPKQQPSNDSLNLPEDVRVLDCGMFVVEFARSGKIIVVAKGEGGTHWTFHPGGPSGFADLHLTRPGEGSSETLFAISHANVHTLFESLALRIAPVILGVLRQTCRVENAGWFDHHGIQAVPLVPLGPDGLLGVGRRRGKRLLLDPLRLEASVTERMREFDLRSAPDGSYQLFKRKCSTDVPYGALLKYTDARGRAWYVWFKLSKIMAVVLPLWDELFPLLQEKLATPDEIERMRALASERKPPRPAATVAADSPAEA